MIVRAEEEPNTPHPKAPCRAAATKVISYAENDSDDKQPENGEGGGVGGYDEPESGGQHGVSASGDER